MHMRSDVCHNLGGQAYFTTYKRKMACNMSSMMEKWILVIGMTSLSG